MNFVIACQMLLKRQIKVVKDMKRREAAVAAVVEEVRYFMIWNSFSHLLFQVTKKQVITHRALAHADGPTQVGNDWKLENSELENLFLSSKGRGGRDSRWLINRERRYKSQVQWELLDDSASYLINDHVTQIICAVNHFTIEPIIFSQMAPERYGSTYPGHKFPMRD